MNFKVIAGAAVLAALNGPIAVLADPITVTATNHSATTTCAEVDNVYYTLEAAKISGFAVTASLPPYLKDVVKDHTAPDFSGCKDLNPAPPALDVYQPPPMILYEDDQIILRGIVDPRFWRPAVASVRVDTTVWPFLDLVQLLKKTPAGPVEFLVFYPQDGSWRLKGLPPMKLPDTSYGSSFLLGPTEESSRPFVAYREIVFDKNRLSFTIHLARGGSVIVTPTGLDVGTTSLDVRFDPPLEGRRPFMALRSMFVTHDNADTAEVTYRQAPHVAARTMPVMAFRTAPVSDIAFGRTTLSRHNVSAPDMRFNNFRLN